MRIGIDFDNTIACYDGVFYAAALERGHVDASIARDKNSVRDDMEGRGLKEEFTALQGYVYGARMDLVKPYPGALEFVQAASKAGHSLFIVSHKTKIPMIGPPYDMHRAARLFLANNGFFDAGLIEQSNAYFEQTKENKVSRASLLGVETFIDDLPTILEMTGFMPNTRKILFAPPSEQGFAPKRDERFEQHDSWLSIAEALLT